MKNIVEIKSRWEIINERAVNATAVHDYMNVIVGAVRERIRMVTPLRTMFLRFIADPESPSMIQTFIDNVVKSHSQQYDDKAKIQLFQTRLPGESWIIEQSAKFSFLDEEDAEWCRRIVEMMESIRPNKYLDDRS